MSGHTRRGFVGGALATIGGLGVGIGTPDRAEADASCSDLVPGLARAPKGGRIDLHAHVVPPEYRSVLLAREGPAAGGYPTPVWTPERALEFMDSYGIQMQVLSVSDPGTTFLAGDEAAAMARKINEYIAGVIKQHPTRFGGFACLPLPDVNAALAELAYALDTLKLDGVALFTSYGGTNVAMPQFDPLWAELDRRGAFVFMHPISLSDDDKPSSPLPDFVVEFTFETTRFCAVALNRGLTTTYPDTRIQLAHAGGAFPFLDYRVGILERGAAPQVVKNPDSVNGVLPVSQQRTFYYDTALNPAPAAMRSILEISDVNHIVFGTDWPYTEALFVVPGDPQPPLSATFGPAQRAAIERANALARLPRVAARLGAPAPDSTVDAKLIRSHIVRSRGGGRQLRVLIETKETVQVDVVFPHGKDATTLRLAPVAAGRRSLHAALPDAVPHGTVRAVLTITDQFGNSKTIRATLRQR